MGPISSLFTLKKLFELGQWGIIITELLSARRRGKMEAPDSASPELKQAFNIAERLTVGKQGERKDEPIFSGLVDELIPEQRERILSFMNSDLMKRSYEDFRFLVAMRKEILGEKSAIRALELLTQEPDDVSMFETAKAKGLLEPENPTRAKVINVVEKKLNQILKDAPANAEEVKQDWRRSSLRERMRARTEDNNLVIAKAEAARKKT